MEIFKIVKHEAPRNFDIRDLNERQLKAFALLKYRKIVQNNGNSNTPNYLFFKRMRANCIYCERYENFSSCSDCPISIKKKICEISCYYPEHPFNIWYSKEREDKASASALVLLQLIKDIKVPNKTKNEK